MQPQGNPSNLPPHSHRRLSDKLIRLLVRSCVILLLLAVTLAVFLFIYPWSMPAIDRQFRQSWMQATGLGLDFENVTFRLSGGLVEVRGPVLIDPFSGEELVRMDEIKLEFSLWEFLFSEFPRVIRNVRVGGLFRAELKQTEQGMELHHPWDRIIEIYQDHLRTIDTDTGGTEKDPGVEPGVVIRHITLGIMNFRWAGAEGGESTAWMTLKDMVLECAFNESARPDRLYLKGRYNESAAADSFRLAMSRNSGKDRIDIRMNLDGFDSRQDLPFEPGLEVRTRDIIFNGSCDFPGQRPWMIDGKLELDNVEIREPGSDDVQQHGRMTLSWKAGLRDNQPELNLNRLELDSELCHMVSSGTLGLQNPFEYNLGLHVFELNDRGIRLMASQMMPEAGGSLDVRRNAGIRISGNVAGNLVTTLPEHVDGTMWFNDTEWHTPLLPAPLIDLDGEIRLTSETMHVKRLTGRILDIPIELDGRIDFRPVQRRVDSIDLSWKAGGSLDNIRELVMYISGRDEDWFEMDGTFNSQGHFHLKDPFIGSISEAMERTTNIGWMDIHDGRICFTGPEIELNDIQGRVSMKDGRIQTEKPVTGRVFGAEIELSVSSAEGERLWHQPFLDIRLNASSDLESMEKNIKHQFPVPVIPAGLGDLQGRMNVNTEIMLPLREPGRWAMNGKLTIDQFRCSPVYRYFRGPLSFDKLEIRMDSSSMIIPPVSGRWGDMEVHLDGHLKPSGGLLNTSVEGSLRHLQHQLPGVIPMMYLDGPATIQHTTHIMSAHPDSDGQNLLDCFNTLVDEAGHGNLNDLWTTRFQGQILAQDAEATWMTMPVRMRGVKGRFLYDEKQIYTPDLISVNTGAGSHDVRGTLKVNYGGHPVSLEFKTSSGHFMLDPWLDPWFPGAWEKGDQEAENPGVAAESSMSDGPAPEGNKRGGGTEKFSPAGPADFVMRGEIQLDSLSYRGAKGSNFRGRLELDSYRDGHYRLKCSPAAADLYEGRLNAEYTLQNKDIDASVSMELVKLGLLKDALFPGAELASILSGRLAGRLDYHHDLTRGSEGIEGKGHVRINDSLWSEGTLFHRFGKLLNLSFFNDVMFDTIEGDYSIRDARVSSVEPGILFKGPLVSLVMTGSVDADENLDLLMRLNFFSGIAKFPVFKELVDMFNYAAGSVLKFRITGTIQDPDGIAL
jgi:hypothetical protein